MWSEAELKKPALITVEIPNAGFVTSLHQKLTRWFQTDLEENMQFAHTAALLSRLIARRKNSFRRIIGFRALLMLNSAVARLLRVDLQRELESFFAMLPDMVFGKKSIHALPTRNSLDFILLRVLTVYDIHQRIQNCSRNAAEYFAELMRANNFLDLNVILISVLAKLRSLNVILGNRFVHLYNILVEYRELFPLGNQKPILASGVEIPNRLMTFELPTLTEQISSNNGLKLSNQIILTTSKKSLKNAEIGKEVARTKEGTKERKQFEIEQLKTVHDIRNFIASENKERMKSKNQCITKKIQNHLWVGAQKIFERKVLTSDEKKAINVFRKFLSSNI